MKEKLMEQTIATNRAFKRVVELEKQLQTAKDVVVKVDIELIHANQAFGSEQAIHTKMIQETPESVLEECWQEVMRPRH